MLKKTIRRKKIAKLTEKKHLYLSLFLFKQYFDKRDTMAEQYFNKRDTITELYFDKRDTMTNVFL